MSLDSRTADARFKRYFAAQIAQARVWYARAELGVRQIPSRRARLCVRAMGVLYGEILTELERRHCDPFAGRARVSTARKLWLLVASVFGRPLPGYRASLVSQTRAQKSLIDGQLSRAARLHSQGEARQLPARDTHRQVI